MHQHGYGDEKVGGSRKRRGGGGGGTGYQDQNASLGVGPDFDNRMD